MSRRPPTTSLASVMYTARNQQHLNHASSRRTTASRVRLDGRRSRSGKAPIVTRAVKTRTPPVWRRRFVRYAQEVAYVQSWNAVPPEYRVDGVARTLLEFGSTSWMASGGLSPAF